MACLAAFKIMVLMRRDYLILDMDSAGICKKEWKETMWKIKMP